MYLKNTNKTKRFYVCVGSDQSEGFIQMRFNIPILAQPLFWWVSRTPRLPVFLSSLYKREFSLNLLYMLCSFSSGFSVLLAGPKEPKGQGRVKIQVGGLASPRGAAGTRPAGLRHPASYPRSRRRPLPIFTMRPPSGLYRHSSASLPSLPNLIPLNVCCSICVT